jgi:hypothetical protein
MTHSKFKLKKALSLWADNDDKMLLCKITNVDCNFYDLNIEFVL